MNNKIHILNFENSKREEREVCAISSLTEAYKAMHVFCKEKNFEIPYIRFFLENTSVENPICAEENRVWKITFDVGSWSEFFNIYFYTQEEAKNFINSID